MRLRSLTHLLDATLALARPDRIVVIGSSSLLPTHPALGEPGQPLETSYDSDLLLTPIENPFIRVHSHHPWFPRRIPHSSIL